MLIYIFFHLSFLNFDADNVESAEEKYVLESDPNGFILGKDQKIDISETPDGARCSGCLHQVMSLPTLYFYVSNRNVVKVL